MDSTFLHSRHSLTKYSAIFWSLVLFSSFTPSYTPHGPFTIDLCLFIALLRIHVLELLFYAVPSIGQPEPNIVFFVPCVRVFILIAPVEPSSGDSSDVVQVQNLSLAYKQIILVIQMFPVYHTNIFFP